MVPKFRAFNEKSQSMHRVTAIDWDDNQKRYIECMHKKQVILKAISIVKREVDG